MLGMKKAVVKLNDFAELHICITPEMQSDYMECGNASADGTEKDCDTCSLNNTTCFEKAFCEIPEIEKLLQSERD